MTQGRLVGPESDFTVLRHEDDDLMLLFLNPQPRTG